MSEFWQNNPKCKKMSQILLNMFTIWWKYCQNIINVMIWPNNTVKHIHHMGENIVTIFKILVNYLDRRCCYWVFVVSVLVLVIKIIVIIITIVVVVVVVFVAVVVTVVLYLFAVVNVNIELYRWQERDFESTSLTDDSWANVVFRSRPSAPATKQERGFPLLISAQTVFSTRSLKSKAFRSDLVTWCYKL